MAKAKRKAGKKTTFKIPVKPLIREVEARIKVAEKLVKALRKGATVVKSPNEDNPPLRMALGILRHLNRTLAEAENICPDNELGCDFTVEA